MGKKKKASDIKLEDISDSDTEIDSSSMQTLNNILNVKSKSPETYSTLKYVLYATAIFVILSLPFTDRLLELSVPLASSWLILLGLKTVIFFILYYILFYANMKND